jgi:hypothetical protein
MNLKPYTVLRSFENYYPGEIVGLTETHAADLMAAKPEPFVEAYVEPEAEKKTANKKPEGNKTDANKTDANKTE